jgi:hypothetical protein
MRTCGRLFTIILVGSMCAACSVGDEAQSTGEEWVGTVTTEGDVTTVVNQSGSLWGGRATLLEEASIGVEAGDDVYMLGNVRSVAASDDRIFVVDSQVPALRVYDWNGNWIRDIGGEGQGPGEFQDPTAVGVDDQGRIWLHEQTNTRMSIFAPDGELLATHALGGMRISSSGSSMTLTPEGIAYVFDVLRPDDPSSSDTFTTIMKPYDVDGNAGEPIEIPSFDDYVGLEARSAGAVRFTAVPFTPNGMTDFTVDGDLLVGKPDRYRFEIRHANGKTTVVERAWEPVAVQPDEAAAYRAAVTEFLRGMDPGWTWSGPDIPTTKPAYSDLVPTMSGEIWVVRPGPGSPVPGCDPETAETRGDEPPCWTEARIVDVFAADGRYLGELDVPDELALRPPPFIRGDDVIARVEDELGTIRVKRYRLRPPATYPRLP